MTNCIIAETIRIGSAQTTGIVRIYLKEAVRQRYRRYGAHRDGYEFVIAADQAPPKVKRATVDGMLLTLVERLRYGPSARFALITNQPIITDLPSTLMPLADDRQAEADRQALLSYSLEWQVAATENFYRHFLGNRVVVMALDVLTVIADAMGAAMPTYRQAAALSAEPSAAAPLTHTALNHFMIPLLNQHLAHTGVTIRRFYPFLTQEPLNVTSQPPAWPTPGRAEVRVSSGKVNTITTSLAKHTWQGTASVMLTGRWQTKPTTKQSLPPLRRLVLWGDVGCGKDTWLATLPVACAKAGRSLQPFDEATAAWQADTWTRLTLGYFPHPTPPSSAVDAVAPVTFTLTPPGGWWRRQQTVRLQITPMTGNGWPPVNHAAHPSPAAPAPYHELAYAAGIICLLDPTTDDYTSAAATLMTMLDRLDFYRRQWKRNRPVRIALWLTKLDHAHHQRHQAQAAAYARQLFGPHLRAGLTRLQKVGGYEFRWGGCSAIGTVIDQSGWRSNSYWDYGAHDDMDNPQSVQRILLPQSLQPENVWEPLEWVIAPMG